MRDELDDSLKLLEGTRGRRPLNQAEPQPRVRLPRVPDYLLGRGDEGVTLPR
jgi:hypothetical protein